MSEKARVTKAAGVVGAATFLSRIFGYVRDMVMAGFFGAGLFSDAFFVAFRIPNLLRRLFAEGSLSISFIPVFTEYLANKGKDEAFKMAMSAIRLLSVLLTLTAIAGILLSPLIIRIIAPGFIDSPEKFSLTVFLTRIMFPYIIFICLVALCMGILNVLGHFAAPALAPVFLNIAMIVSVSVVSFVSSDKRIQIIGLSIGVLIGGILQLAFQIPFLIKKGAYFWQKAGIWHPGLKKVGILMLPAVFGTAVYQINLLIGTLLASLLPDGSISFLYYADRLAQFPLGIFALSIGTAILPSLSRQASANEIDAFKETFAYAMKLVFFIILPSMVGLIILREPIVALLFQRGAFNAEDTRLTAYALMFYGIGLWAIAAVRIVVPAFYALQDTKTPVKIAIVSVIVNIILSIILMGPLSHGGLALATSISSMLNFGLLIWALRTRLGTLGGKNILKSVCKSIACSAVMGAVVWKVADYIIPIPSGPFLQLLLGLFGSVFAGLISYILFSFLLKSAEFGRMFAMINKGN